MGLSGDEKRRLLDIARRTIRAVVGGGAGGGGEEGSGAPDFEVTGGALLAARGAFVTLHKEGALRGCIGVFDPGTPLWETVKEMARSAATRDPRFEPLGAGELGEVHIEISALTPLERTLDAETIEVGRHGIYIKKGAMRGVLLPQVATDHGWDRETFLEETCRKAGLPRDAWMEGAEIYTFEAEVFGEEEGGEVDRGEEES